MDNLCSLWTGTDLVRTSTHLMEPPIEGRRPSKVIRIGDYPGWNAPKSDVQFIQFHVFDGHQICI